MFRRLYLEQLANPPNLKQQEQLDWGEQFHRLMQQQELGLAIAPLLNTHQPYNTAIASLLEAVTKEQKVNKTLWQEAEHTRTLKQRHYLLTVVYDLLTINTNGAEIFDWKTYLRPKNTNQLTNHWQTRLYPYVLVETSDLRPEQIGFTYWFVQGSPQPQPLRFQYSDEQHQKNRRDLAQLLTQLDQWLDSEPETAFSHHPHCQKNCPYFSIFDTQTNSPSLWDNPQDLPQWIEKIDQWVI